MHYDAGIQSQELPSCAGDPRSVAYQAKVWARCVSLVALSCKCLDMTVWLKRITGLAIVPLLLAVSLLSAKGSFVDLTNIVEDLRLIAKTYRIPILTSSAYVCGAHQYKTQIVSLDPLVIYIHNFLSDSDIDALLESGEPKFKPSLTTKYGRTAPDPSRTSLSAFLPNDTLAVQCVLDRARAFSGTLLQGAEDELIRPQLVRYTKGQRFNLHFDWYPSLQNWEGADGGLRKWNRIASFFAILEDDCEGGETWFPNITADPGVDDSQLWRKHPDGGLAFRPIKGNSLFWMNLDESGKGDKRVKHAGLPVKSGRKTAMNIWPRRYFE